MLGVLRAAIPGAAFAQTWPNLVSVWTLDETSGPTFADSGPANVQMDIVGSWADLSTASIIEGVGGTSAYTNGSGHASIPAGDPQHDLTALTISFYYQRNSAAAKHILLAAGDGTQAGDFSIEVLANGRLRGYHVGQDGVLRFFESGSGITGTNLQVGSAHRVDLTLGSVGARIYLDGAPLTGAFIPANTNGWNNARIKYLGVFTDGVSSPADGLFDVLRIWDQQLNGAQIETLEPAQSITLGGGATVGLSRPVLSFASGQDPVPGSNVIWIAPKGNDNNPGTQASPKLTLAAAHNAIGGAGWTIVCRGGVYNQNSTFNATKSGTSDNPITMMAAPGETPIFDANKDLERFKTPNQGNWELIDNSLKLWRSAASFSNPGRVHGQWTEPGTDGYVWRWFLWDYLADNTERNHTGASYEGPMVKLEADGRIYIRFQQPSSARVGTGWPDTMPGCSGGNFIVPRTQNPNDYEIYLCRRTTTAAFDFNGASNWIIKDINIVNSDVGIQIRNNVNGFTFRRGWIRNARIGFIMPSGHNTQNFRLEGMQFDRGRLDYYPFHWTKFTHPNVTSSFSAAGVVVQLSGGGKNWAIEDCRWFNNYDGLVGAHLQASNLVVRYNWFEANNDWTHNFTRWDGFEVGYNVMIGSSLFSAEVGPAGSASTGPGYIHHNIADRSQMVLAWGREGEGPGMMMGTFRSTFKSSDVVSPLKIYNNTVLGTTSSDRENANNFAHAFHERDNTHASMHEVYNNAFIIVSDVLWNYGEPGTPNDHIAAKMALSGTSNEMYDHNHYERRVGYSAFQSPAFVTFDRHKQPNGEGTRRTFATLADLKASSANVIKAEANGTFAQGAGLADPWGAIPLVDIKALDYRPKVGSVLTSGAKNLTTRGWPGAKGDAWRGALHPNGTGREVGPRY